MVHAAVAEMDCELLKFDGGMEIRIALRNKGDAVRTITRGDGKYFGQLPTLATI